MCKRDNRESVGVWIPADLSATGKRHWNATEKIDSCIAPLVRALSYGGIDMRGSCCGHGKEWGHIALQDGRMLIIVDADKYYSTWRFIGLTLWQRLRWLCLWIRNRLSCWHSLMLKDSEEATD